MAVQNDVTGGRLRALTIEGLALTRSLYVAWDARRVLSPPARVFRQFLGASEAVAAH